METMPVTHLEVGTCYRLSQLIEQRLLHFRELIRVHNLEDVFHFIQKHDFLCAVYLGPISKQTEHNLQ